MDTYNILILGASYGSLLGAKLALAGHNVKLVCLPQEANLINSEGARVRLPVRASTDSSISIPTTCPARCRRAVRVMSTLRRMIS